MWSVNSFLHKLLTKQWFYNTYKAFFLKKINANNSSKFDIKTIKVVVIKQYKRRGFKAEIIIYKILE